MKNLNILNENLEPLGTIPEWKYKFRKWAAPLLMALILISGLCISNYIKYKNAVSDNDQIIEYISQSSGEVTGNIQTLIGKYHIYPNKSLADSTVLEIIQECGAWYPEVIMAQYIVESGRGTSSLAKSSSNLFGMKVALRRPTTQLSGISNNGYGVYLNKEHSIIDRILWERWVFKNEKPSREVYLTRLCQIYAEAPNYIETLEKVSMKYR